MLVYCLLSINTSILKHSRRKKTRDLNVKHLVINLTWFFSFQYTVYIGKKSFRWNLFKIFWRTWFVYLWAASPAWQKEAKVGCWRCTPVLYCTDGHGTLVYNISRTLKAVRAWWSEVEAWSESRMYVFICFAKNILKCHLGSISCIKPPLTVCHATTFSGGGHLTASERDCGHRRCLCN